MNYKNAVEILPLDLVCEIQKYIHGQTIYIPSPEADKAQWGSRSGAREGYRLRNEEIRALYARQVSVRQLSQRFFLSEDSIRKILRNGKKDNINN